MKNFWMLIIGGLLAFGCVSKKKYLQAEARIDNLQKDSTSCTKQVEDLQRALKTTQKEYAQYQRRSEAYRSSLIAQLEEQGQTINVKDEVLQERAERLKALQERLNSQQSIVNNLRSTIQNALVNFDQDELSVEVKKGKVYVSLSDKLLFPSGSAQLNRQGKEAIGKVAQVLKENPSINIEVIGHTDSIPINTARYQNNWDLSVDRATTITELLTADYQIAGARLTASGKSKYQPVASNKTRAGRAKNRRTEIILTPKLEELFQILDSGADKDTETED